MKIRAKANGNILEMSAEQAQPLIDAGVYEAIEDPQPADADEPPDLPRKGGQRYKRRDVVAEE